MPVYKAPLEDFEFIIRDCLPSQEVLDFKDYSEFSLDLIMQVLEEGGKFCENELLPINLSGDEEGCHYENGVVRTPKGFKEAYNAFVEAGWTSVAAEPEYGGQGLPSFVNFAFQELICASNMAFGMYPGLTHGAYEAILHFAPQDIKDFYLPKMVEGKWSGTMCLTEPHCGTDLGLIKTKAAPNDDGTYKINGTKIFISAGEHDLTENIIHLVLARLPGAPEGIKGISMFLVPKFIPKADGSVGPRNGMKCGSIEHKMGIKASSTCVMNLDDATGWLVSEPHKGMRSMFKMMNAARLAVGMQGLGVSEISYQNARAYAKDRLQGRSLRGVKYPDKPADPIIVHPDVRKNLLTMKAFNEGARAFALWIGMEIDFQHKHPDPKRRAEAEDLVALMIPIIKSMFTDYSFEMTNLGMQIFGGHGYIHEYGMEQFVRDARITQIYEGANGIQALDLIGRKLPLSMGRLLRRFFHPCAAYLEQVQSRADLLEFVIAFTKAYGKLQQATAWIAQKGMSNPDDAGAAASDYLHLFGLTVMGYLWLKMADKASQKLESGTGNAAFYKTKIKTARFFFTKLLPETNALFIKIMAGSKPLMDFEEDEF